MPTRKRITTREPPLKFAEKHPDDPRVPESLSRAVKNTSRNCNNGSHQRTVEKSF